jgi:hypothetical protein
MTITTKASKTPVQIQIRQAVATVTRAICEVRGAAKTTRTCCLGKATMRTVELDIEIAQKAIADANAALDTLAASDWRVAAGADHIAPMGTMAATVAAHLRGCVPGERAKATAAGKAIMVACKD